MNYSFRTKNKTVKYLIIHYTGMIDFYSAYRKLIDLKSEVSCHYLISREGKIYNLLCPKFKGWHAGISEWKNVKNLNDYSIGIELENKGHEHGYTNFTNSQYHKLKQLIKFLKFNFYIKDEDIIFHSDIAPNRKKDPGEKFIVKKLGVERFNFHQRKKFSINRLLKFYGFSQNYIKIHKADCIKAAKRSLNYKTIDSSISKNFKKKLNNLLFK
jgi:N-acetylmuramoyl-L-alanine amidase